MIKDDATNTCIPSPMPGLNTFKIICDTCYRECTKCVKPIFSIGSHINISTNNKISSPLLISLHTHYCQLSCCKVSQIKHTSNASFVVLDNTCLDKSCSPHCK